MRDIRIYQPGDYRVGEIIELSEEAGRHVGVVLRMQPGDKLCLFRGDNHEFEAVISSVHKKKVAVNLLTDTLENRESSRIIHLAQAISKGDRMETVVQKAVELGVASITPLVTQHCALKLDEARMEKKRLQWQAIAISACEQSGRNTVPTVHPVLSFQQYLQKKRALLNFVLYPDAQKSWRDYEFKEEEIGLIIGPEGGLSFEEIQQLFTHNFLPLSLGPRVLRTETAAIVALSVLQAVCGDL